MSKPKEWWVRIVETRRPYALMREIGPYATERIAEKARDGVEINLDLELYGTEVVER